MNHSVHTVLFDLDGTLLDTAPDLAFALNTLLVEQKRAPLPFEQIRPFVSYGSTILVKMAFNLTEHDQTFTDLRQQFLNLYVDRQN